jgi:subtilisin-like proprotein convertase family protein
MSAPISSGSAPYTGYFQPAEPLSTLSGISPVGDWTLIVQDTRDGGDPGKLLCGLVLLNLPPP